MLNRSASLVMSTSVLKALPGKLDIKRHSPSVLYEQCSDRKNQVGMIMKYHSHTLKTNTRYREEKEQNTNSLRQSK